MIFVNSDSQKIQVYKHDSLNAIVIGHTHNNWLLMQVAHAGALIVTHDDLVVIQIPKKHILTPVYEIHIKDVVYDLIKYRLNLSRVTSECIASLLIMYLNVLTTRHLVIGRRLLST